MVGWLAVWLFGKAKDMLRAKQRVGMFFVTLCECVCKCGSTVGINERMLLLTVWCGVSLKVKKDKLKIHLNCGK